MSPLRRARLAGWYLINLRDTVDSACCGFKSVLSCLRGCGSRICLSRSFLQLGAGNSRLRVAKSTMHLRMQPLLRRRAPACTTRYS